MSSTTDNNEIIKFIDNNIARVESVANDFRKVRELVLKQASGTPEKKKKKRVSLVQQFKDKIK